MIPGTILSKDGRPALSLSRAEASARASPTIAPRLKTFGVMKPYDNTKLFIIMNSKFWKKFGRGTQGPPAFSAQAQGKCDTDTPTTQGLM